jgi:alpha-glucosidase
MSARQSNSEWWRGGVIYQIYPRSFADSNGDGIGDLPGITGKLDYIAKLGVDGIWLSPFFQSPMKDFGYDISDYRAVDPMFGTLQDFDRLVHRAHELGLKVMVDQVLSHTSDQHAWFKESRSGRDNPRSDWYIWADAKPDGSPPNNWLSIFGGSAWQWDTGRCQYYLHNFLTSQPDLNFHNEEVQAQVLDAAKFWLDRGVDGFRLDVVNFYFHDQQLRDNPPWGNRPRDDGAIPPNNPYALQEHRYDKTQPENIAFLRRLRALLDRYQETTSVGEIGADDPFGVMAEYTGGGDKLHMAYVFNLLGSEFSARHIRRTIEEMEERLGSGWPCWSIGNHDVPRVMTRWGGPNAREALGKVLMALLGSLRGSVCIYQGEELALTEADIPYEKLQDPSGITFWPEYKGRDGCRTPMPWTAQGAFAGFSEVEPWLPIPKEHRGRAVDLQDSAVDSVLNAYRRFLAWRRNHPTLRIGSIRFIDAPKEALALVREHASERIVAAFNLSDRAVTVPLPAGERVEPLTGHGFASSLSELGVALPPYGAFFGRL